MTGTPKVSIIIPCRNEEKIISKCLDSVVTNDYPKNNLEVLVVDGMSTDRTKEILEKYSQSYPFIKILENPNKFTPFSLNIGIKQARGDVIMRLDAHATYQKDHISKCLKYLEEYEVDNVGGAVKAVSLNNKSISKAIAFSLSSPFGVGGSYFRLGVKKPIFVDTVFGGCYRKKIFKEIGLFNEKLIRSQDLEFNLRLKRSGGKILLAPDIVSQYYPKSNLRDFFSHNISDGIWSIYPLKFVKIPFSLRHYLPLVFILTLLISVLLSLFLSSFMTLFIFILAIYFLFSFYFSCKIVLQERKLRYLLLMPIVFATRHFGYGLGSLLGLIKLLE